MSKLLRPDNPRVCLPPARPPAPNEVPHVVVAALMRSGTHLLIDLLLNHFAAYRRSPLYANLDTYLEAGLPLDELQQAGGMVIKTHCPQAEQGARRRGEAERFLFANRVLIVRRDGEEVKKSLARFSDWGPTKVGDFDRQVAEFEQFWESHPGCLVIDFEDLTCSKAFPRLLRKIAVFIDQPMPSIFFPPWPKNKRGRILIDKALTRLFGSGAPRINTGIGLGHCAASAAQWEGGFASKNLPLALRTMLTLAALS